MKVHLLVVLLMMPFTGCMEEEEENCCEDLDRYVIASGTASTTSSFTMEYVLIPAFEDSLETHVQAIVQSTNLTYEEALVNYTGNFTHLPDGMPYNESWADYDAYEWEITLVSGEGTWDVIWLDYEGSMRATNSGAAFWNSSFSKLDQREMSKSGSKGPVDKPEQTCSGDSDNDWMTPYGFINNCEQHLVYKNIYTFMIVNAITSELVLEWSIYGWK